MLENSPKVTMAHNPIFLHPRDRAGPRLIEPSSEFVEG